jgi:MSHA biogenesis protein MshP
MRYQRGFGAIAAIVVLVILATLAAAIVSLGSTQQLTSAQDVMSTKAWQAARAGNDWGLYQALQIRDWAGAATTCDTAQRRYTLNLVADTGFEVAVVCDSWLYNEGESVPGTPKAVRIYRVVAVACPAAPCPAADASSFGYVERTRVVLATN